MKVNRANLVIRLLGLAIGLFGFWCVFEAFRALVDILGEGLPQHLFGFIFTLLFAVLGGYGVSVGVRVWRPMRVSIVVEVTAITALVLWMLASDLVSRIPGEWIGVSESAWTGVTTLGLLVVAICFYIWISRLLIARSSAQAKPAKPVSKHVLGLLCFWVWLLCNMLLDELGLRPQPGEGSFGMMLVASLLPILLAVLLYKVLIHYTRSMPGLPFIGPWLASIQGRRLNAVQQERIAKHQCPDCGYDVHQTLADRRNRCPECGLDLSSVIYPETRLGSV